MFEWHGWASIVGSSTVNDDEDAERDDSERRSAVERLVADQACVPNEVVDIRYVNGACHVWLTGSHNHRSEKPIELFRAISAAAPGSYGIMHCFDHNHIDQPWQRWVMRRGRVRLEQDTSLSPHIGLVEDPDDRR
jgi:immunity protein 7 of polymorphic toxin system